MDLKQNLLDLYSLKLDKGWYWQKKENMSPWKVFSENAFNTKDILWLVFRVHKLCGAKYNYFSQNISDWNTISFYPDSSYVSNVVQMEAFQHKMSGRIITITRLQQITDKSVFNTWIDVITKI